MRRWRLSSLLLSTYWSILLGLHGADGGRGSVITGFFLIIRPLEDVSQWFRWCYAYWGGGLSTIIGYCYPGSSALESTFGSTRTWLKLGLKSKSREPNEGVWTLCLTLWDHNESLPLPVMLTEIAARWGFLALLSLLDLGFSEAWVDNRSKTDCLLGGDVAGIGPRQQLAEWTVTSWHPTCRYWDDEMWTCSSEQDFHLLLQKLLQVCIGRTQSIQHENSRRLKINPDGLKSLRVNPRLSLGDCSSSWVRSCFSFPWSFSFQKANLALSQVLAS